MIRTLVVDEDVAEEAEAQARYYWERGGEAISLRFVAELEAAYRGLTEGRLVGVNHPSVRFGSQSNACFSIHFRSQWFSSSRMTS
jgi:plasmid stabilization system protein ParE